MGEYKALASFSGAVSMSEGEIREINDEAIVKDLLKAGYIEPLTKNVRGKPAARSNKDNSKN